MILCERDERYMLELGVVDSIPGLMVSGWCVRLIFLTQDSKTP